MTETAESLLEEQLTPRSTKDKPRLMARDVDLTSFLLDVVNEGAKDIDIVSKVVDGTINRTIEGASSVEVVVHDYNREIVNSGAIVELMQRADPEMRELDPYIRLLQSVDVSIDGYAFRLVGVRKAIDDYTFIFEDRDVARMRQVTKPYKVRRKVMTRAQFIHSMVLQTPGERIPFWCPDEDVKQALSKKDKEEPDNPRRDKGVAKKTKLKVGEDVANESQRQVMEDAIAEGDRQNASFKVLVAGAITVIQESRARTDVTPDGIHVGPFQQDARYWPATKDTTTDARAFFKRAKQVAREHPDYNVGELAIATQLPGWQQQTQYSASQYGQWREQGEAWVRAYSGKNGGGSSSSSSGSAGPYEFKRGEDGQEEDTWSAALRLADEVNWALYVANGVVVFASDERLIESQPWALLREGEDGVETIDWDIDYGKTVHEAYVTARIDRWDGVPGYVVIIDDESPAAGRWLISEVSRPMFSSLATITLKRRSPAKPEPRAASSITDGAGDTGDNIDGGKFTGRLARGYAEAKRIDAKNYPYAYGGGHGVIGRPSTGTNGKFGYDCSGYVSAILHAMGLLDSPVVSGALESMFQPGEGEHFTIYANKTHTFCEFRQPGGEWEHWGTGSSTPGGGAGKQNYIHTHSGFVVRHPKGM